MLMLSAIGTRSAIIAVPEPATLMLLGLGLALLGGVQLLRRRRNLHRQNRRDRV